MRAYAANFLCYTLRHKIEINTRKEKKTKEIQKEKEPAGNISNKVGEEERKANLQIDIYIELKRENWVSGPILTLEYEVKKSPDEIFERRDYTKY